MARKLIQTMFQLQAVNNYVVNVSTLILGDFDMRNTSISYRHGYLREFIIYTSYISFVGLLSFFVILVCKIICDVCILLLVFGLVWLGLIRPIMVGI